MTSFRHTVPVRYGEVDMQGVVFNAHYLAYCDDASDTWFREALGRYETSGWEPMVVKAVVEWQGSATIAEVLTIDVGVSRWGNTSFDLAFAGTVAERPVFTATITYVGVDITTKRPTPVPPAVRGALGG